MTTILEIRKSSTCKIPYKKTCRVCGVDFIFFGSKKNAERRRTCSRSCYVKYIVGKNNPRFKNGHYRPDGYKVIRVDGRPELEHRYLMEQKIGRRLNSFEVVHHKDGNSKNNSLDNLEIYASQADHCVKHCSFYRNAEIKECTRCHKIKSRLEFTRNAKIPQRKLDPHDTRCKECRRELKREWSKKRKELRRISNFNRN